MKRESAFQRQLMKKLRVLFPGCVLLRTDPNHLQGVPDVVILWHDMWAALECKASGDSRTQPNQDYYIKKMNRMSFASFITPENEELVLAELQFAFGAYGSARLPQRQ